jgi:hypothetical protein
MRWQTGVRHVEGKNLKTLVELFQQFQRGEIRFMVAFRHPSIDDPFTIAYLLARLIPQTARQVGISLAGPLHTHFLYDRGIPLWAGPHIGWLYSQLGGTPILRGKVDRLGLRSARELFAQGPLPIAAAPEGATNGHSGQIAPLESGVAQMGFWCVEDLQKANKSTPVLILPLGISYDYPVAPWGKIAELLGQLEVQSGLTPGTETSPEVLYQRLLRLGERLVGMMESFYNRYYQRALATQDTLVNRLVALRNAALSVAEQYLGISKKDDKSEVNARCRRIEQAGWDRIYRDDVSAIPLEQGLGGWLAQEASLHMEHMRLVEQVVAISGNYVQERPTVERFAETILLIRNFLTRVQGLPTYPRPSLGDLRATVTIAEPIPVSPRWQSYQANRRLAVAQLNQDLKDAFVSMLP